jgi:hypothetical protein
VVTEATVTISRLKLRALTWLAVMALALAAAAILFCVLQVRTDNANWHQAIAAQQRQGAAEQAQQRRAGLLIEEKLCTTLAPLGSLSALEAPAGSPAANPSRAFEQRLVQKLQPLAGLAPDLGCGKSTTGGNR